MSDLTAQLTMSEAPSASSMVQSIRTRAANATSAMTGAIQNTADRFSLLRRDSQEDIPAYPSDGTVCERCGSLFSFMNRRMVCPSCDKFLCTTCFGGNVASGWAFLCLCRSACIQCTSDSSRQLHYRPTKERLESGTSCVMTNAGSFFSDEDQRIPSWLHLDTERRAFLIQSLEQSKGVPLSQEQFLLSQIVYIRSTGLGLDIRDKDKIVKIELEQAAMWAENMNEAVEVETTMEEKCSLVQAKNEIRLLEMEERRKVNEERKKRLTDGGRLGMRFTAEAMSQ